MKPKSIKLRRSLYYACIGFACAVLAFVGWLIIESEILPAPTASDHLNYYKYYFLGISVLMMTSFGFILGRAQDELLKALTIDELTGLLNQKAFFKGTQEFIDLGHRFGDSLSVIMIDIDYFKLVNDNHSHMVGSFVLKQIGQLIADDLRKTDLAARFGGDEFIITLPRTQSDRAMIVAERLRQRICDTHFIYKNFRVRVTASMGIATSPCLVQLRAEELAEQADQLLYVAKEEGRNRICTASMEENYTEPFVERRSNDPSDQKAS